MNDHNNSDEREQNMQIYDADTDLNKLFNLPGLMATINNYQRSFVINMIIEYIPICLITGILLLSVKVISKPLFWYSIVGGYFIMQLAHIALSKFSAMVDKWIYDYNSKIHDIVIRNHNDLNINYLIFILERRIAEKKEGNKIVKQTVALFFAIIGFSTFTKHEFNNLLGGVPEEQKGSVVVKGAVLAFFIAWLIVEAFSNFIKDPNSLQNKWGVLYESVKKLELSEKEKS